MRCYLGEVYVWIEVQEKLKACCTGVSINMTNVYRGKKYYSIWIVKINIISKLHNTAKQHKICVISLLHPFSQSLFSCLPSDITLTLSKHRFIVAEGSDSHITSKNTLTWIDSVPWLRILLKAVPKTLLTSSINFNHI